VASLLIVPHLQTLYLPQCVKGRKQEKFSWSCVRGVLLFTRHCGTWCLANMGFTITEMDGCDYDLPLNRPPFLGHYGELHRAYTSLPLNKNAVSQFYLVQRSDGARHIRNSVRELSDLASFFSNYKVALSVFCCCITFCHKLTQTRFLRR